MGQSGCSEVSKEEQANGQATGSGGKAKKPNLSVDTSGKDVKAPLQLPPASPVELKKNPAFNGIVLPPNKGVPDQVPEPVDIQRLRQELRSKEEALQAVQKGAAGHVALIEALEREAFQKDEAIGKLKASEATQREVATLIAELRKRDNDLDKLRRRAQSEEATLRSLTAEAQTKGDVVKDLVVAISEQGQKGGAETSNGTAVDASKLEGVTASRKPIVGGNWKCNPDTMKKLDELIENINKCDTSKCDVFVCPSPIHVPYCLGKFTNGAMICPQNCNFKGCGAFTGEVPVEQMIDLKIEWVLIGHSERRELYKETDELLATKLKLILDAGMKCVFAIGEKLPEREKGMEATMAVCIAQLEQVKGMLDPEKVVIAYEPVWAIGTGVTATPEQAQQTHAEIRKWIAANVSEECAAKIRIQYGGSANAKNAPELSACPDIDGFLVGGASLKPEFADIVAAISAAK